MAYFRSNVLVCSDPECVGKGSERILESLLAELSKKGLAEEVKVMDTPRIGDCDKGPEILVYPEGYHYVGLTVEDIPFLVEEQFLKGRPVNKLLAPPKKEEAQELREPTSKEVRVVLRNCGKINPENIEEYIAENGYAALAKVLTEKSPDDVIQMVKESGLRGRGGAGFSTGMKWALTRDTVGDIRYIICNADEGDPGAFHEPCSSRR